MRIALLLAAMALPSVAMSCTPATPESVQPEHIAGRWELTTGTEIEWMDLEASGSFTGTIQGRGFLAQTLSQGPEATISGQWELDDTALTITIEQSSDDALAGQTTRYEIVELTDRTMTTEGADGTRHELIKGM